MQKTGSFRNLLSKEKEAGVMTEQLVGKVKKLIAGREYRECEKIIAKAMADNPHSAEPQNLMGILMEKEQDHVMAMKHFRAAYALDPTYLPARYNMEQYGSTFPCVRCAYTEEDCPVKGDPQFQVVYDERHVGHLVRR